jgi:hypothetical protein
LVVLDTSRIARVKPGPKPFSATGTVLGIKAELDRRAMIRNFAMGTLCTTLLPVMILSQDYSCYDR